MLLTRTGAVFTTNEEVLDEPLLLMASTKAGGALSIRAADNKRGFDSMI